MEHEEFQFDDPSLKGAVLTVWGDERAPQRLRGRISRLVATAGSMDELTAGSAKGSPWELWQGRIYGLVAAAVIIVGVGLLVLYYNGAFEQGLAARYAAMPSMMVPTKTDVPVALAQSMIATHSACGKLHDHRLVSGVNTYAALNLKLTADLGFPSLARSIGEGWKFQGAGECIVGDLRGSHLMFARASGDGGGASAEQRVSVFSLPVTCMSGVAPGARFEGPVNDHSVAGFARSGAVYAVVGSSGPGAAVSLETVTAIRDGLFGRFDDGCGEIGEPDFFD